MLLFNELIQWALLVLVSIVCFGLTRQLGHFIVARRDHLLYSGPDLGKTLPSSLLGDISKEELAAAIRASPGGRGVIVTLSDKCHGCTGVLDELRRIGKPAEVAIFALVNASDELFLSDVERHFDFVALDPDGARAKAAGLLATPFLLGVDNALKVRHRGISSGLHDFVREWSGEFPLEPDWVDGHVHAEDDHPVVSHA